MFTKFILKVHFKKWQGGYKRQIQLDSVYHVKKFADRSTKS